MKLKYLLTGLVKSIPGIEKLYNFHKCSGGDTASARYCYSIWMRHLVLANKNGLSKVPATIVELGPGHTLGVGIAALLSGATKYYGLDLIKYANSEVNRQMLHELVGLFVNKTAIPDNTEFPLVEPQLQDYSFPADIITDEAINKIKQGDTVKKIEDALTAIDLGKENELIIYKAPWFDVVIEAGSVDMVLSQTVLQHIDGVEAAYSKMHLWLKRNGFVSNTIDFQSMLSADKWYGHWNYTDLEWKIVKGRKKFHINRLPLSKHLALLNNNHLQLVYITKKTEKEPAPRNKLAKRFKSNTAEDLSTAVCFLQAIKKD